MAIDESNLGKYPYISLAEIKNYLEISSSGHDARLSNLINYACGVVEHYIGREVLANNYSETFEGGYSSIFVSRLPLSNVYSVFEFNGDSYISLNPPAADGSLVSLESDNHTLDVNGNTFLSSRIKKFGQTSAYFNGSTQSDFITTGNGDDWWFDTEDFTIDLQARFASFSTTQVLIEHYQDSSNFWSLSYNNTEGLQFRVLEEGTEKVNVAHSNTQGYEANTWHHFAVSKNETSLKLFRDGTQIGNTTSIPKTTALPNFNGSLSIARSGSAANYYSGFLDELRVSKAGYYSSDFTSPSFQHLTDNDTVLLVHFEGSNGSVTISDTHASQEDFVFTKDTGEISRNVGSGAGYQRLSIQGPKTFENFPRAVKVNYRAGYEIGRVPSDLQLATLDYIKLIYKQEQDRSGFNFQGESVDKPKLSANFPPHIKRVLDLYRLID